MAEYTKGPWVESAYDGVPDGWIEGVLKYAGCGSHEAEWSSPENKRLALAAPELLEALQAILPFLDDVEDVGPIGFGWKSDSLSAAISHADSAIAKATGADQ